MENIDVLRQLYLFKNLDDTDLHKLAAIATERTFSAGSQVFAEGSSGDSLFVIKYGSVRVLKQEKTKEENVTHLSSGQHFGEMALIDNAPRSATVIAVERTEMICIEREDFEKLVSQDIGLGFRVYKRFSKHLCRRLRETTDQLGLMRERSHQSSD